METKSEILDLITELKHIIIYLRIKGGQGSGSWGHSGRVGRRGGSRAGSGGLSKIGAEPGFSISERKKLAKGITEEKRLGRKTKATRMKVLAIKGKVAKRIARLGKEREIAYARYSPFKERTVHLVDMVMDGKISMSEYKKRDAIIREESAKAAKGIRDFHAKENKILGSVIEDQRKLLYAKEDPANINPMYGKGIDDGRKRKYQKGVDEFSKMVGKGTILDITAVAIFDEPDGRSSQSPTSTGSILNMSKSAGAKAIIHELGHSLEDTSNERHTTDANNVRKQANDFLSKRTKGERNQSLNSLTGNQNYGKGEVAKPDKFIDPYMGKIYKGGGTEIISMGLEQMWDNPAKFANEDPEYFDFILMTLENARTH